MDSMNPMQAEGGQDGKDVHLFPSVNRNLFAELRPLIDELVSAAARREDSSTPALSRYWFRRPMLGSPTNPCESGRSLVLEVWLRTFRDGDCDQLAATTP